MELYFPVFQKDDHVLLSIYSLNCQVRLTVAGVDDIFASLPYDLIFRYTQSVLTNR